MRFGLLRHAKAAWPPDVGDEERPLADRGVEDAAAMTAWLLDRWRPDRIVASTALRARQTAAPLADALGATVIEDRRLYEADDHTLGLLVKEYGDGTLFVGHNPTFADAVSRWTDGAVDPAAGFKPGSVAVLDGEPPTCGLVIIGAPGDLRASR